VLSPNVLLIVVKLYERLNNEKGIIILLLCFWAITKVNAQLSLGAFTGYLVPIGNNAEDVF